VISEDIVKRLQSRLPRDLWSAAKTASGALSAASHVTVAAHIDADGISAGAVASTCLERQGISHGVRFLKKLDDGAISELKDAESNIIWYVDLGSGSVSKLEGRKSVVTDHHVPDTCGRTSGRTGQWKLTDFSDVFHVNPQLFGVSGANELSGAGTTFLVAVAMNPRNADLAYLGVLGSVGDLQDQRTRRLEGLNRSVLEAAVQTGRIEAYEDIRLFGRETRPVYKMLEYASDPFIPGVTGSQEGAIGLLLESGVEPKMGDVWRSWSMLSSEEKSAVIEALRDRLESRRGKGDSAARLTGEVYTLPMEPQGSALRDSKEFATLLNACGRHAKAEVGLAICAGDRGERLSEAMTLLRDHRSALSQALGLAKDLGITRLRNIQYFDAGDDIEDTIVGTVAGMLLGEPGADRSAPMVALADSTEACDEPTSKASARGTQKLVSMGMDLSQAIRGAAESVGGVGGGHNIAAGATIPSSKKQEFLEELDSIVGSQLTSRAAR